MTATTPRRAAVVGTGLIGASIGLALRAQGWHVTGSDVDTSRARRALELGAVDALGSDGDAELTFVAVPVAAAPEVARAALAGGGVVTDVGSVKAPVVAAVDDPGFVGGHPMAGSEALGPDGARADLFDGAVWVLTPSERGSATAFTLVHSVVRSLGADVVTLAPEHHDRLVAAVSHVPHLTAASLMGVAARRAESEAALLRLAAGGFRDMTRIAAGDPTMWLDICAENRDAIVEVMDALIESLSSMRSIVQDGDADGLAERLGQAQSARRSLPIVAEPGALAEVRVAMPDRPGELAAITTLATELSINVHDVEVAHNVGEPGRLLLVVDADRAAGLVEALDAAGRSASAHELD